MDEWCTTGETESYCFGRNDSGSQKLFQSYEATTYWYNNYWLLVFVFKINELIIGMEYVHFKNCYVLENT